MGFSDLRLWLLLSLWVLLPGFSSCQGEQPAMSSVVSSFSHRETSLRPYDWTYLRVEFPPSFSSVLIVFASSVDIDEEGMKHVPKSSLPVICFKYGSPPVPDVSDEYLEHTLSNFLFNGPFRGARNFTDVEQCIPFQQNLTVILTNEQISPGVWYFGFFNGLGAARTQSKMINRGKSYIFTTSIIVEGCSTSTIWGPYCNQTIDMVSCSQSSLYEHPRRLLNSKRYIRGRLVHPRTGGWREADFHLPSKRNAIEDKGVMSNTSLFTAEEKLLTCNNLIESSCLVHGALKFFFLDIVDMASQFKISLTDFRLNQSSYMNIPSNTSGIHLMCFARYNAMPSGTSHDHFADISRAPLIVMSPKIGRWYIAIQAVNQREVNETNLETNLCFSFEWQVHACLDGKAGINCTWETYMLQRVPKRSSTVPFESYYLPIDEIGSLEHSAFSLEQLLSNSSVENAAWTYFFVDIPPGAAGANMRVQLLSDTKVNYGIYCKYGALPSIDTWDYYANSTNNSNGSMFLATRDATGKSIGFYILYAKEGTWCFGLKHPPDSHYRYRTTMSIALEGCPEHCNYNGVCHSTVDQSGLTFLSYCACDRDHGGFDCSNELVSSKGHLLHSIFLVASNAAAILPSFWALRQKLSFIRFVPVLGVLDSTHRQVIHYLNPRGSFVNFVAWIYAIIRFYFSRSFIPNAFAEWVLFTSSGISSGIYHACDAGSWCVLSFRVLQFLDFWLSFMAIISTFIYMATIDEASKRAIQTSVSILTALLAVTGATRSANVVIVIAIGMLGLLFGWFLEFSTARRSEYCSPRVELNLPERWQNVKSWFWNLMKTLQKRFRWRYMLLGFIALALAVISWCLETNGTYWIWHSLWHISAYTSSFFFLCSTSANRRDEHQEPVYELTRQNSSSRTVT